jgi:hypothetical protein
MQLFLLANGYDTAFDDTISWADEVIALVEHRSSEEDFVRVIRPFAVPRQGRRDIGRRRLLRAVLAGSVWLWNTLGACAALASSRDFGTAGTCRRPRIALARFSRSRPPEAAFVFHALADPNVVDGGAASNLGGDA